MAVIVLGPRLTVNSDDLVGFIIDPQDKRYREIFRVGDIHYDCSNGITLIHHICPDGDHYASRNVTFRTEGEWMLQTNERPDVGPPCFFYRHIDESPVCVRMSSQGEGPLDFLRSLRAHNVSLAGIAQDYRLLFGQEFPLRTDQSNFGNTHNGHI